MTDHLSTEEPLKNRLQHILNSGPIEPQRALMGAIARDLGIDGLTCAAALLCLAQAIEKDLAPKLLGAQKPARPLPAKNATAGVKMVRYRLDVGSDHHVTLDQLKKVLVDESGVDKNNINNINIQNLYTLIELPDEMPPDIFQHLKLVEINQQKLAIRRVKTRKNKKRGPNPTRRGKKRDPKQGNGLLDPAHGHKTPD